MTSPRLDPLNSKRLDKLHQTENAFQEKSAGCTKNNHAKHVIQTAPHLTPFTNISSSCCYNKFSSSNVLFTCFSSPSYNVSNGREVLLSHALRKVSTKLEDRNSCAQYHPNKGLAIMQQNSVP